MLMMICIKEKNEHMYVTLDEYYEVAKSLRYLGVDHIDYIVQDKMYRINWYDESEDKWHNIWCTEEEYEETLSLIKEIEVEYEIYEYN